MLIKIAGMVWSGFLEKLIICLGDGFKPFYPGIGLVTSRLLMIVSHPCTVHTCNENKGELYLGSAGLESCPRNETHWRNVCPGLTPADPRGRRACCASDSRHNFGSSPSNTK